MTTLPFRSILCPVDYSPHAAQALRHAHTLAVRAGARLTVAWVTDPLLAQAAVNVLDPHGDQARADLRDFVADSLSAGASARPEPELVLSVGKPEHEIPRIARDQDADLIVLGTHGLTGYKKMFFGSTTERVLRHATMPVLAVPLAPGAPPPGSTELYADGGTAVIALDRGPGSAALAAYGVALSTALQARPVLVHVVAAASAPGRWQAAADTRHRAAADDAREALSQLARDTASGGAEAVVLAGSPPEEIAALAMTRRAGLIVMGLLGRTRLAGARPGSIAYRVLVLSTVPVLVVPPSALESAG